MVRITQNFEFFDKKMIVIDYFLTRRLHDVVLEDVSQAETIDASLSVQSGKSPIVSGYAYL